MASIKHEGTWKVLLSSELAPDIVFMLRGISFPGVEDSHDSYPVVDFRAMCTAGSSYYSRCCSRWWCEPTATLPPPDGVYSLGDTCIPNVCLGDITISDFVITSSLIVGSDQVTMADAMMGADVFQNSGGVPGAFINPITLSGSVDFIFFGRTDLDEVGTFDAQITEFDFTGTFMGISGPHTVEAILNPNEQSLGTTTVTRAGDRFFITSFFDVFGELSIDGGPFQPGPERHLDTGAAPEPASVGLVLAGSMGLGNTDLATATQSSVNTP